MAAYWPGPTRLYDPDVDAGAVLMTKEQAWALVVAAEGGMRNCGYEPVIDQRIKAAISAVCFTFGLPQERGE